LYLISIWVYQRNNHCIFSRSNECKQYLHLVLDSCNSIFTTLSFTFDKVPLDEARLIPLNFIVGQCWKASVGQAPNESPLPRPGYYFPNTTPTRSFGDILYAISGFFNINFFVHKSSSSPNQYQIYSENTQQNFKTGYTCEPINLLINLLPT